jgi:hypothetical protein
MRLVLYLLLTNRAQFSFAGHALTLAPIRRPLIAFARSCCGCRMAATLHSKINRKRLDKLDIIKIW